GWHGDYARHSEGDGVLSGIVTHYHRREYGDDVWLERADSHHHCGVDGDRLELGRIGGACPRVSAQPARRTCHQPYRRDGHGRGCSGDCDALRGAADSACHPGVSVRLFTLAWVRRSPVAYDGY